jgi:hypothetical protein
MGEVILGGEALAAGVVTRHELRQRYTNLYRGVYIPKGRETSLRDRAVGAWLVSRRRGVIAGVAASGLHGAPYVDSTVPIELLAAKCAPQAGLIPRTERVADDEITQRFGLPVTTRVRTAFDLGRHLDRQEALARLDALMWNQVFAVGEVLALTERYPRARGIKQLRELLPLVDGGASSPRESRIRLLLVDAGFPQPETQIAVIRGVTPVAWLDVGWSEYQVAVEYDGDHHRKNRRQYVKDIARLRMLEALGWIVIRVIAEDSPQDVIARVESALLSRGCAVDICEMQRPTRTFAA